MSLVPQRLLTGIPSTFCSIIHLWSRAGCRLPPRCRQSTRKLTHPLFRPEGWWNHPLCPKSYSTSDKSRMCEFANALLMYCTLYHFNFKPQTSWKFYYVVCIILPWSRLCINNRGCSAYWENKLKMTKWVTFWGGYLSFDASSDGGHK